MIVFLASYGFSNVTSNLVSIGLAAIPSWAIVALLYFLPLAIMIAELAAVNRDKSAGIYSWIESSLGTKWAFVGIWSYYISNLFYLQMVFGKLPVVASWMIFGKDIFSNQTVSWLPWLGIGLMVASTVIAILGVERFSTISDIGGHLTIIATLLFTVFAVVGYLGHVTPSASQFSEANLKPNFDIPYFSTFSWLLLAVAGSEIAGTYIQQVNKPAKTYTKSVLIAAFLLVIAYVLGSIAVCLLMSPDKVSSYGIVDSQFIVFQVLGNNFHLNGKIVVQIYAFINLIASIACYVIWLESPIRAMFSAAPQGIFPKAITNPRADGTLVNALWMQCGILFVLMVVPLIGAMNKLEHFFVLITNLCSLSTIVPYAILAGAYLFYRYSNKQVGFAIIKSRPVAIVTSIVVLFLSFAGFIGEGMQDVTGAACKLDALKAVGNDYGGPILLLTMGWIYYSLLERRK